MKVTDYGESSYRLDLNDRAVMEKLLREYAPSLIRYAYTFVGTYAAAEDAMEDAFAALLVRGGHFRSPQHLQSWLYKTTRNKAVDYLRHHSRETALEDAQYLLGTDDAEQSALIAQRDRQLFACIQRLPQQYREILLLTYYEDFSVEQICALRRKTKKQVYNLLARAKASLKEQLSEEGITYEDLR